MDPGLALKLENKIKAVLECELHFKNRGLPPDDAEYTVKVKTQYLAEIRELINEHPELSHHPALFKIEAEIKYSINECSTNPEAMQ